MEIASLVLEFVKVLAWPVVVFIAYVMFRAEIRALTGRITKAALPGGVGIDFASELKEAKQLSQQVETNTATEARSKGQVPTPAIPLTEANARMISLGLRPSPSGLDMDYYRGLAAQDPSLALVALRIEIDILSKNLAKGFAIDVEPRDSGSRLLRRLKDQGAITTTQLELGLSVLKLCNAAAHGQIVSREQAEEVIDLVGLLIDQYISWLSWGFDDGWTKGSPATPDGLCCTIRTNE